MRVNSILDWVSRKVKEFSFWILTRSALLLTLLLTLFSALLTISIATEFSSPEAIARINDFAPTANSIYFYLFGTISIVGIHTLLFSRQDLNTIAAFLIGLGLVTLSRAVVTIFIYVDPNLISTLVWFILSMLIIGFGIVTYSFNPKRLMRLWMLSQEVEYMTRDVKKELRRLEDV